jgi:hypothetical protein
MTRGVTVATIAELIKLPITPEEHDRHKEIVNVVSSALICPGAAKPPRRYECHVLNFLLEHKEVLGIQTVFRFENLFVDGALLLADGTRLAVEIKMRMNWTKACQAGWQFQQFLRKTDEAKTHPVSGAIVFFEEFQGDGWNRQAKCRVLQNGWNAWYTSHADVEGYRVDLFRVSGTTFEYYALAKVGRAIADSNDFSEDKKRKVMAVVDRLKPHGQH